MKNYPILRLLLAALMLYFAWPMIPVAATALELTFWAVWLFLFLLVVGANFANLLQLIRPPAIEQEEEKVKHHMEH